MHRALHSLALAAFLAALAVAGGAAAAWALSPDDAIYLSGQGVDDDVIIAKICADGEAWDLTADDISYLADQGVSDAVIEALIDPASAADRYGFRLGDGDQYSNQAEHTPYVFSSGYYYGPIARAYFYDPFFYSYLYCDHFAFSFSYWPTYYAGYCWPYAFGFYGYPYFSCGRNSFYNGFAYCGSSYRDYRNRYRDGFDSRGGGNVSWRDWRDGSGSGRVSYRSPDGGDRRKTLNVGGDVERRIRAGNSIALAPNAGSRGNANGRWQRNDLGRVADRESRSRVEPRGSWTLRQVSGNRRETSDRVGHAWGPSRSVIGRPDRSSSLRRFEPAPREGGARVYRFPDRASEPRSQAEPRVEQRRETRAPERAREPQVEPRGQRQGERRGRGDLSRFESHGNGEEHKR